MNASVYDENLIDFTNEPIFFGSGKNTQRYDTLKYKVFDELRDKMLGQYWSPDEIDVAKDKRDFEMMPPNMRTIYTRVIQKLIFLDSVQGRGMLQTFGNLITNPEFESVVTVWQAFELIHSKSYTHILRSVYPSPDKIFDESFDIKPLVSLSKTISSTYDLCHKDVVTYLNGLVNNPEFLPSESTKESLIRLMIEINILEGIRFFSGFATIWSMHYSQGFMEKTSLILKMICRDELLHLRCSQILLKILKSKECEGFTKIFQKVEPEIPELFENALKQEFDWIDYLFSDGSFLGMTPELSKMYLKYIANKRARDIGIKPLYDGAIKNPIPWIDGYINYDNTTTLPQESEIINYRFDIFDKSISANEMNVLLNKLHSGDKK